MNLREAAQQALEALEEAKQRGVYGDFHGVTDALRVALEQPSREWRGLTEEEIIDGREQLPTEDLCNWSFRKGVEFAEAALARTAIAKAEGQA